MSKEKKDIQREIYNFIENNYYETGEPTILQDILNEFCPKYHCSTTTVQRYLDELVNRKSPFALETRYDKNRYYCIPIASLSFKIYIILTAILSILSLCIDVFGSLPFTLLDKIIYGLAGFWIAMALNSLKKNSQKTKIIPKD